MTGIYSLGSDLIVRGVANSAQDNDAVNQAQLNAVATKSGAVDPNIAPVVQGSLNQLYFNTATNVLWICTSTSPVTWVKETPTGSSSVLFGTTAPTSTTVGTIGQFYVNTTTSSLYVCNAIASSKQSFFKRLFSTFDANVGASYSWLFLSGAGGDVSSQPKDYGTNGLYITNTTGDMYLGSLNNPNIVNIGVTIKYNGVFTLSSTPSGTRNGFSITNNNGTGAAFNYVISTTTGVYYSNSASFATYTTLTTASTLFGANYVINSSYFDDVSTRFFTIAYVANNFKIGIHNFNDATITSYASAAFSVTGQSGQFLSSPIGFSAVIENVVGTVETYFLCLSGSSTISGDDYYLYTTLLTYDTSTHAISIGNWTVSPSFGQTVIDSICNSETTAYITLNTAAYLYNKTARTITKLFDNPFTTNNTPNPLTQSYLSNAARYFTVVDYKGNSTTYDTTNRTLTQYPTVSGFTSEQNVWGLYTGIGASRKVFFIVTAIQATYNSSAGNFLWLTNYSPYVNITGYLGLNNIPVAITSIISANFNATTIANGVNLNITNLATLDNLNPNPYLAYDATSGSYFNQGSVALTLKVSMQVLFASNSTGSRVIWFNVVDATGNIDPNTDPSSKRYAYMNIGANPSDVTVISTYDVCTLQPLTGIAMYAYQSSGATLNLNSSGGGTVSGNSGHFRIEMSGTT